MRLTSGRYSEVGPLSAYPRSGNGKTQRRTCSRHPVSENKGERSTLSCRDDETDAESRKARYGIDEDRGDSGVLCILTSLGRALPYECSHPQHPEAYHRGNTNGQAHTTHGMLMWVSLPPSKNESGRAISSTVIIASTAKITDGSMMSRPTRPYRRTLCRLRIQGRRTTRTLMLYKTRLGAGRAAREVAMVHSSSSYVLYWPHTASEASEMVTSKPTIDYVEFLALAVLGGTTRIADAIYDHREYEKFHSCLLLCKMRARYFLIHSDPSFTI